MGKRGKNVDDAEYPKVPTARSIQLVVGAEEDEESESYGPIACVQSAACCCAQLCTSIPFFIMAAIATHLWHKFTPVYREVEFEFGSPQILGKHINEVDLNLPLSFKNPNPYPLQIHERRGTIFLANSQHELGHFQIPSAWIPQKSEASFSVRSEVIINGVGDVVAVLPQMPKNLVEFWFVAEDLEGEAKIDLFATKLGIAITLSRACSAKFNRRSESVQGDMFCSENRTQLERRIPAPDLLFPELTAKYEGIKNRAVGAMMAVGYLVGGILLFFATLTYQNLQDEHSTLEACIGTEMASKQAGEVSESLLTRESSVDWGSMGL